MTRHYFKCNAIYEKKCRYLVISFCDILSVNVEISMTPLRCVTQIYCITLSECDMKNIFLFGLFRDVLNINVQISVTQTAASCDCPTMFVLST